MRKKYNPLNLIRSQTDYPVFGYYTENITMQWKYGFTRLSESRVLEWVIPPRMVMRFFYLVQQAAKM